MVLGTPSIPERCKAMEFSAPENSSRALPAWEKRRKIQQNQSRSARPRVIKKKDPPRGGNSKDIPVAQGSIIWVFTVYLGYLVISTPAHVRTAHGAMPPWEIQKGYLKRLEQGLGVLRMMLPTNTAKTLSK